MAESADERAQSGHPGDGVPALVVVCGLPGVGKSRVARELADRLPSPVFRTDGVRKDLYDRPTYDSSETRRVYAAVLDRALGNIGDGGRAVLDGTYRCEAFRADVAAGADRLGVDCAFLKVECSESVVRRRITGRTDGLSDAGLEEYHTIREEFDPLARPHAVVDNSGDWADTRRQLRTVFPDGV